MAARSLRGRLLPSLLTAIVMAVLAPPAFALITGGEGNAPIRDPGWPKGAAAIFNVQARIAWWEGPPFGGGQWHAECRGSARALNAVLTDFARLDVRAKQIVVHDGVGSSFWLNMNSDPAKRAAAKMDWSFMVWQPDNWKRLSQLPPDLNPTRNQDAKKEPPAQIDIYTEGNIKWSDVIVPRGLTVVDQRLEAHGFTTADGIVLEGHVSDVTNKKPLSAQVRLEQIDPQPKGGYRYTTAVSVSSDAAGHWVIKNGRAGWFRLIIEAAGHVPRVIGYVKTDGQPQWQLHDGGLARPAVIAGQVKDEAGHPLADVEVRLGDIATVGGTRYETAKEPTLKTDADGRFRSDQFPVGSATVWVHKPGYCRPGLGQSISTPKEDIELTMARAGRIVVTVDFTGTERPAGYIVNLEPEGGNVVGSYGGSGNINEKNQMIFDNIPPGRYFVHGRPNPGSDNEKTERIKVDLKGGKTAEIKLQAK
jgi:hypothetical protein